MFNTTFSHGTIRNTVVAFGNLFNGLKIRRFNPNGSVLQEIDVPLAYSARERWITRLLANPDLQKSTSITLPRMAFEILEYRYDSSRKLNSLNKISNPIPASSNASMALAAVPYNIEFALYIASKTIEDGLQMLEQILPFFSPHYNVTINSMPSLGRVEDVPIILNTTSNSDSYAAEWLEERIIIYTLMFTAKINLYGPVTTSAVIKTADVNVHTNILGAPVSTGEKYHVAVNPLTANEDDVYTLDELWSNI